MRYEFDSRIPHQKISNRAIIVMSLHNASIVKWISQRSSEPLFKVRILVDAQDEKNELLHFFLTCAWAEQSFCLLTRSATRQKQRARTK